MELTYKTSVATLKTRTEAVTNYHSLSEVQVLSLSAASVRMLFIVKICSNTARPDGQNLMVDDQDIPFTLESMQVNAIIRSVDNTIIVGLISSNYDTT